MGEGVLTASAPAFDRPAGGALHCEGVALAALAEAVGTPAYVYSAGAVRTQYRRLTDALSGVPHRIHYSMKANSALALLAVLRELGAGVDIVSGGELHRALAAGFGGADVVFSGVGKTAVELDAALAAGVRFVNVESEGELRLLDAVARGRGVVAPVALRVNPEVVVTNAHAYIATGERGHKFGIAWDDAPAVARLAGELPGIALVGLDMHIGSMIGGHAPYAAALDRLCELHDRLAADGAAGLRYLDVGGGLAVPYDDEAEVDVAPYAAALADAARRTGLELVLEPGRYLVANAGVLLTRVLYRKRSGSKEYIITDAGMNDLVRPSHYQAYHHVDAVEPNGARTVADVVGPVCETGDFFALARETDDAQPGDLMVVRSAGAYGFVMASNYNSRPRPAELLVDGARWAIATERETYDDLVRRERAAPEWRSV